MNQRTLKTLVFMSVFTFLVLLVFPVAAQITPLQNCGQDLKIPCTGSETTTDLGNFIVKVINAFLVLTAIIAALFIIIGGLQYIFSAGDDRKASTAKTTILYAIIGLIIVALAGAIVSFTIKAIQQQPAAPVPVNNRPDPPPLPEG